MMWVEAGEGLYNLARMSHLAPVGDYEIAIYDQFIDADAYMEMHFNSTDDRNNYFKFLKKVLKVLQYGQTDTKAREKREVNCFRLKIAREDGQEAG
jgi:hypothetical protein